MPNIKHFIEDEFTEDTEKKINIIIKEYGLNLDNNYFFFRAKEKKRFDVESVYKIAYNWREITKNFLFTTISGLGYLAKKISQQSSPDQRLLSVLQTAFQIISDDLGINKNIFLNSPSGIHGIHFKWWEDSIVIPLSHFAKNKDVILSLETKKLIQKMNSLTTNYLGVAAQLRVVEAIAQDICITFHHIFGNTEFKGLKIFNPEKDLNWINSHIRAESIHHQQVCDEGAGMAKIASTIKEKEDILSFVREYASAWSDALNSFTTFL